MLRSNDADVSFSMSESASPSQSSIVVEDCWPSEKGRGLPKPMRWSSQPRKKERKVGEVIMVGLVLGRLAIETVRWSLEWRRRRRGGGGGGGGGSIINAGGSGGSGGGGCAPST